MKKVVFIGGALTNGKSYLARKLSEELMLPWISTDSVREFVRKVVYKDEYETLFKFTDKDLIPEEYLILHLTRRDSK